MTGYLDHYEPEDIDYVRATLALAEAHGLKLSDLARTAEHAQSPQEWDAAVNLLCHMTPQNKSA